MKKVYRLQWMKCRLEDGAKKAILDLVTRDLRFLASLILMCLLRDSKRDKNSVKIENNDLRT